MSEIHSIPSHIEFHKFKEVMKHEKKIWLALERKKVRSDDEQRLFETITKNLCLGLTTIGFFASEITSDDLSGNDPIDPKE